MKKKNLTPFYIGLGLCLFAVICVCIFLFTKDDYAGQSVAGLEVMQRSYPGLFIGGIFGFVLGAGCLYLAYANITGEGIGRRLNGREGWTIAFLILAAILICGPWGKACSDKANGGWTLPKQETPAP